MRHIIDQIVNPQIPDTSGDCRIMFSMIFIFTRINRLNNPDLPGNEWGGIMKLNQLITTVMVVGRYDCITCLNRYLCSNKHIFIRTSTKYLNDEQIRIQSIIRYLQILPFHNYSPHESW